MLPDVRKQKIVDFVTEHGGCSVTELAEELDCSKGTIRRHLDELEAHHLIERTHGGAVPAGSTNGELPNRQTDVQNLNAKTAIAKRAVEEIGENEVVFFDSGTTTMQIAKRVPSDGSFLPVTNSPLLSLELSKKDVDVKLTGGTLRRHTDALVGPSAEQFIERTNFDLLFLGTDAIDVEMGLMTTNEDQARLKELMIKKSRRVVLVADSTKIGKRGFVRFADFAAIDTYVTNAELSSELRKTLKMIGTRVIEVT